MLQIRPAPEVCRADEMRESTETISGGTRMISAISVKYKLKNQSSYIIMLIWT